MNIIKSWSSDTISCFATNLNSCHKDKSRGRSWSRYLRILCSRRLGLRIGTTACYLGWPCLKPTFNFTESMKMYLIISALHSPTPLSLNIPIQLPTINLQSSSNFTISPSIHNQTSYLRLLIGDSNSLSGQGHPPSTKVHKTHPR